MRLTNPESGRSLGLLLATAVGGQLPGRSWEVGQARWTSGPFLSRPSLMPDAPKIMFRLW